MVTEQCTDSSSGGVTADIAVSSYSTNKFLAKASSVIANDFIFQKTYRKSFGNIQKEVENIKKTEVVVKKHDLTNKSEEYLKTIAKWLPLLVVVCAVGFALLLMTVVLVSWKLYQPSTVIVVPNVMVEDPVFIRASVDSGERTDVATRKRCIDKVPKTYKDEDPGPFSVPVFQQAVLQDETTGLIRNMAKDGFGLIRNMAKDSFGLTRNMANNGFGQESNIVTRSQPVYDKKFNVKWSVYNQQIKLRITISTKDGEESMLQSNFQVLDILNDFDTMATCHSGNAVHLKQSWACHLLFALEELKKDLRYLLLRVFVRFNEIEYDQLQVKLRYVLDVIKIFYLKFDSSIQSKMTDQDPIYYSITNSIYSTGSFSFQMNCFTLWKANNLRVHKKPMFELISSGTALITEDLPCVHSGDAEILESKNKNLFYIFTHSYIFETLKSPLVQLPKMVEDTKDTNPATYFTYDFTSLSMQGDSSQKPSKKAVKGSGSHHEDGSSGSYLEGLIDSLFTAALWEVSSAVVSSLHLTDCCMISTYTLITCVCILTISLWFICRRILLAGYRLIFNCTICMAYILLLLTICLVNDIPLGIRKLTLCQCLEGVVIKILKFATDKMYLRTIAQLFLFAMIPGSSKLSQESQEDHLQADSGNEMDSLHSESESSHQDRSSDTDQNEDFKNLEITSHHDGPNSCGGACLPLMEEIQPDPDSTSHVEKHDELSFDEVRRIQKSSSSTSVDSIANQENIKLLNFKPISYNMRNKQHYSEQTPIKSDIKNELSVYAPSINDVVTANGINNSEFSNSEKEQQKSVSNTLQEIQIIDKQPQDKQEPFIFNTLYCVKSDVCQDSHERPFRDHRNLKGLYVDGNNSQSDESREDSREKDLQQPRSTDDNIYENQDKNHVRGPVPSSSTQQWGYPELPRSDMTTCFAQECHHLESFAYIQNSKAGEFNHSTVSRRCEYGTIKHVLKDYGEDDKGPCMDKSEPVKSARVYDVVCNHNAKKNSSNLERSNSNSRSNSQIDTNAANPAETPTCNSSGRIVIPVGLYPKEVDTKQKPKHQSSSFQSSCGQETFIQNLSVKELSQQTTVNTNNAMAQQQKNLKSIGKPAASSPAALSPSVLPKSLEEHFTIPLELREENKASEEVFVKYCHPVNHQQGYPEESTNHKGSHQFSAFGEEKDLSVRKYPQDERTEEKKQKYQWPKRTYVSGSVSNMMNFLLGIESAVHGSGVFLHQFSPLNIDCGYLHFWTVPQHSDGHRTKCMDVKNDIIYIVERIQLRRFLDMRRGYEVYIDRQQDNPEKLQIYGITKTVEDGCHYVNILHEYRKVVANISVFIAHNGRCCGGRSTCKMFTVPKGLKVKDVLLPEVEALKDNILVQHPHLRGNMYVRLRLAGCSYYPSPATRINCCCMLQVVDSLSS